MNAPRNTRDLQLVRECLNAVALDLDAMAHSPEFTEDKAILLCAHRDVEHALFTLTFVGKKEKETT